MFWKKRVRFGEFNEMTVVEWELKELSIDRFPGFVGKGVKLVDELLVFGEGSFVLGKCSFAHLNYNQNNYMDVVL